MISSSFVVGATTDALRTFLRNSIAISVASSISILSEFMSHPFRMGWWNFPCYPVGMARLTSC